MHDGTSPPRTPALPRFAAQWYGLASLFGPIRIASHRITAASNPVAVVELELRNRYTVRLVGTTHGIASTVRILTDAAGPNNGDANAKTDHVEDRWGGSCRAVPSPRYVVTTSLWASYWNGRRRARGASFAGERGSGRLGYESLSKVIWMEDEI